MSTSFVALATVQTAEQIEQMQKQTILFGAAYEAIPDAQGTPYILGSCGHFDPLQYINIYNLDEIHTKIRLGEN